MPANDALDRFGRLRTGTDDRFDELPVGIFVAPVHQLGHGLAAIGPLVVDTAEIQRREGVVGWTDEKDRREASSELLESITKGCGLERTKLLAGAAAKV